MVPIGLSIIGSGYFIDTQFYPNLFGFRLENVSGQNVYRAFGLLYLSMCAFWLLALKYTAWRPGALLSITFLMLGLAVGRILSIILDGIPHSLILVYLGLEIVCFLQALFVYRFKYKN